MSSARRPAVLSESSYGRSSPHADAPATVVLWAARAVYVGPSLQLSAHKTATAIVALALEGTFDVCETPGHGDYRAVASVLIPANTYHHVVAIAPMAFVYLDPLIDDVSTLACATVSAAGFRYDLALGDVLRQPLGALRADLNAWSGAKADIRSMLPRRGSLDGRIVAATRAMRDDPATTCLGALARAAGISPSRFLHLFKDQTGIPFRRFRYWCRLQAATRSVQQGCSLTMAALDAGFASQSHFNATFRTTFGLAPRLLQDRVRFVSDDGP